MWNIRASLGVLIWQDLSIFKMLKRLWEQKLSNTITHRGSTAPEEIKWGCHKVSCSFTHSQQPRRNSKCCGVGKKPCLTCGIARHLHRKIASWCSYRHWHFSSTPSLPPSLFPPQSHGQLRHWQKACVSFHLTVTLTSASIISSALGQSPLGRAADLYLSTLRCPCHEPD